MLKEKEILLGVTGGIACYKAVELLRLLKAEGANVNVVMTKNATEFVTPLTFQTLSENPVLIEPFNILQQTEIKHVSLADKAELLIIAPATANIIGKIANGIADDLLTTMVMACKAPKLIAPAMNVNMWENPIVQENIKRLKSLGYNFVEPEEGYLACGYEGKGRLVDFNKIVKSAKTILKKKDLVGEKILVTAGPTKEPIDPVRYVSNLSSGKMGYAIATSAKRRGAEVFLITGPTYLQKPIGIDIIEIDNAENMRKAVLDYYKNVSIVIMSAAVADYRAKKISSIKIKNKPDELTLNLVKNPDILKELSEKKDGQILVGFAAETNDIIKNATKKLEDKDLDMIVANDVTKEGAGFNSDTNIVKIIYRNGKIEDMPKMSKEELADIILDRVLELKNRANTVRKS